MRAARARGFDVPIGGDGLAALALIDACAPTSRSLDVGLPGIDGLEVARRVRSRPAAREHVRSIALTGYGQRVRSRHALQAGFDEHLVKPVRADDLLRLLADMGASGDVAVV